MDLIRVVDVVPNNHSNETNQDSEPSIAVNPANPAEIVITAFTPPDSGVTNAPVYVSTDGGTNWALNFDIPGGASEDQTVAFSTANGTLYGATLTGSGPALTVFRAPDPTAAATAASLDPRTGIDQPWAEARTVATGSDAGKDRLLIGYNDDALGVGTATATVDVCTDAAASSPAFTQRLLETRSIGAGLRDGYAIRPVANADGTVYVAYERWTSGSFGSNITTDIVVARDDNWGEGGFGALTDPSDNKAGRLVATGVTINDGGFIGQERLNNDLAVAVDPGDSDIVYIAWADNSGPNYTIRVRRSLNRGIDWSGDLLTVDNATMTSMAINSAGVVGLMYQQVTAGRWETHFRRTTDGTGTAWSDVLLCTTPSNTPAKTFDPYLGDWARVVAVAQGFYGTFCANNTPDPANFPAGISFLRNHSNAAPWGLLGTDGTTAVAASIDPFFFSISAVGCTVVTDRSTFGKDEIDAMLHAGGPAVVSAAFYVEVDGFTGPQLGVTAATLSGTPNVAPTITFAPTLQRVSARAMSCAAEDAGALGAAQRFTWTYDLVFTDDSDFVQEHENVLLTATISGDGTTVEGQAVIELTLQPNPYEIDGPVSWLSVDLQVFSLQPGQTLPSSPGVALGNDPNDFMARLLSNTPGSGGYNDPGLPRAPLHPFDLDLLAHQDTSTVEIAGQVNGHPVFNFAVARVRYRALSTDANPVRVFFRLFQAATTSTEFQPTTTYLTGGQGATKIPLLGVVNTEVVTIPFFAAPRVTDPTTQSLNAQTDPLNVQRIGPDSTGAEVQAYFGCWLDINQTANVLPSTTTNPAGPFPAGSLQSIQTAIVRSGHQCLVAEINFDQEPVSAGATPASSDKLAQRNLAIIGHASPHLIPQTFDLRPTPALAGQQARPDELMIDWGNVPTGTQGSVYLPGTTAATILALAGRLYQRHDLTAQDDHTIGCRADGLTFIPLPPGTSTRLAGLLTVALPDAPKSRETYRVIARQITDTGPPRPTPQRGVSARAARSIRWRRVVGSFQVSIPRMPRAPLLAVEERQLAVLRYIAETIPPTNRWYPVIQRYLEQLAGRVGALGGDPGQIEPSPNGIPPHRHGDRGEERLTGKVAALRFDAFGDFEGFCLATPDREHELHSREADMAVLIERAWRERLRLTVIVARDRPHVPLTVIVHRPPVLFGHHDAET